MKDPVKDQVINSNYITENFRRYQPAYIPGNIRENSEGELELWMIVPNYFNNPEHYLEFIKAYIIQEPEAPVREWDV